MYNKYVRPIRPGGGGYIMTSNDVHSCKKSSAVYKPSALTSNCAMMSAFVFASTAATTAPEQGGQGKAGGWYALCMQQRSSGAGRWRCRCRWRCERGGVLSLSRPPSPPSVAGWLAGWAWARTRVAVARVFEHVVDHRRQHLSGHLDNKHQEEEGYGVQGER